MNVNLVKHFSCIRCAAVLMALVAIVCIADELPSWVTSLSTRIESGKGDSGMRYTGKYFVLNWGNILDTAFVDSITDLACDLSKREYRAKYGEAAPFLTAFVWKVDGYWYAKCTHEPECSQHSWGRLLAQDIVNSIVYMRNEWARPKVYVWAYDWENSTNRSYGLKSQVVEQLIASIKINYVRTTALIPDKYFTGNVVLIDSLVLHSIATVEKIRAVGNLPK